jgi:hypothetical protein
MIRKIIIGHQAGDGANFLISCLSMSDDIYYFGLNKNEKLNDPCMWSMCLTSKTITFNENYTNHFLDEKITSNFIFKIEYPFNINIDGNVDRQEKIIKFTDQFISSGSRLILFENPTIFFCLRNFFDNNGISNIFPYDIFCYPKGFYPKDEILNNLSIKQYFNLPIDTKKYFEEKYNMTISDVVYRDNLVSYGFANIEDIQKQCEYFKKYCSYTWNVNWYLSEKDTIDNIKRMYNFLNISGYDEKIIRLMYRTWIKKLDLLKKKHL